MTTHESITHESITHESLTHESLTHESLERHWGGPADMTAWEGLMWRAEGDRRTRSTGLLIELLDREPDWDRVVAAHERLTRQIPRLRDRVVEPLVPLVTPAWSLDPHFDLSYHLQHVRLPEPGSIRQLLDFAAAVHSRPLDRNRPPWEAFVVSSVADGRAAYVFKAHHSLTAGMELIQLLELAHSSKRTPGRHISEPTPKQSTTTTPVSLLSARLCAGVTGAPGAVLRDSGHALGRLARAVRDPVATTGRAVRFGASVQRMLTPPSSGRSPVLRNGGFGYRFVVHDVALNDLAAAGTAGGGSVDDAFVAGVLGALRRFHEHRGVRVDTIPLAMPIRPRSAGDEMGGAGWAAGRFEVPVGEPDPRVRIGRIRELVRAARDEPAVGFLELVAPAVGWLPAAVLSELAGELRAGSDVQASTIPGPNDVAYLAGAKITRLYTMGPRPGAAVVTMLSYDGTCCLGVNVDPAVVGDIEMFERCLREGFDEVLALAKAA